MRRYSEHDDDRGYDRDDRGFFERAGDEVRSWFGDEEAERRRRIDERYDRDYDRDYDRRSYGGRDYDRGGYDRGNYGSGYDHPYGRSYGRGSYDRGVYGGATERGDEGWRRYESGRGYRRRSADMGRDYGRGEMGGYQPRDFDRGRNYDSGTYRGGYGRESSYGAGTWAGYGRTENVGYGRRDDERSYGYGRYGMGEHAGRGPEGYQRSTDRLMEDVCERLTRHGDLDATNIRVKVENGEVTLEGSVDSRWAKRMAEDTAEMVEGVRDVHNHLRVNREWEQGSRSGMSTGQQPSTPSASGQQSAGTTRTGKQPGTRGSAARMGSSGNASAGSSTTSETSTS